MNYFAHSIILEKIIRLSTSHVSLNQEKNKLCHYSKFILCIVLLMFSVLTNVVYIIDDKILD